jgi:hypothetical protein
MFMKNSFKKSLMFLMLLLALTFSALGVTPALADDGVTPPADAPAVEQPVVDAPVVDAPVVDAPVVDAPATEEPIVAEVPAVEEPIADATIVEQPTADEPAAVVSEILEAAPEGTEVVVLDESGEALPLASAEAAEVLASGDPYFWDSGVGGYVGYTTTSCPTVVDPANCHVVIKNPIQAAVDAFAASSSASGEIFIEAGTYDEKVDINGYTGNLGNLSGLTGKGSDMTTINGFLNAYGFINPFTLSGITFSNQVYIGSSSDITVDDVAVDGSTSNDGMYVYSGGNVELNNVSVTNSYYNGAGIYAAGDVTINDSDFSSNGHIENYSDSGSGIWTGQPYGYSNTQQFGTGSGLDVSASGKVTLDNVSASGNYQDGVNTHSNGSAVITNSQFDNNGSTYSYSDSGYDYQGNYSYQSVGGQGTGLYLSTNAGATLDNVSASGNYRDGANIYTNGTVDITDSQFNSNGTIDNFNESINSYYNYSNSYFYDIGNGLSLSGNAFTLTNVTSNDNVLDGVVLNGRSMMKSVSEEGSMSEATIKCSTFENNGGYGVNAVEMSGALNLNNVTFNGNTSGDYNYNGTATINNIDCNPVVDHTPTGKNNAEKKPLYIVIEQTQEQLPAGLGDGFKFGSALKVELTNEGKDVNDLAITLSFPIPADMKDAKLAVMFWNGSAWVEVSGGSVVDGLYVITVSQPGNYVLVAK